MEKQLKDMLSGENPVHNIHVQIQKKLNDLGYYQIISILGKVMGEIKDFSPSPVVNYLSVRIKSVALFLPEIKSLNDAIKAINWTNELDKWVKSKEKNNVSIMDITLILSEFFDFLNNSGPEYEKLGDNLGEYLDYFYSKNPDCSKKLILLFKGEGDDG